MRTSNVLACAAMTEAVERPAWRLSFQRLLLIALGLAAVAFVAGRTIYVRYGGYRPLALSHVPATMRYRARVETSDQPRMLALGPLLTMLDPRHVRLPALERTFRVSARQAVREFAFGVGPDPFDFVLVAGLELHAETGLSPARTVCEVLASDGIRPVLTQPGEKSDVACRLPEGAIVADAADGGVVVASRAELVKGLLGRAELGDRLGFAGPSVRGLAPEVGELGREATTLALRIAARYP